MKHGVFYSQIVVWSRRFVIPLLSITRLLNSSSLWILM